MTERTWTDQELLALGERRPTSPKWQTNKTFEVVAKAMNGEGYGTSAYTVGRLRVVSQLIVCDYPDGDGQGPTWIVSISRKGRRIATTEECRRLLRHLGIGQAEEDNHEPGIARKFWWPLDPAKRVECQCKETEETVIEPSGMRWQRKRVN